MAGTSGFLKKTAANAWALDTSTYLTGNQSITFTGDATGSGTTSVPLTLANTTVVAGSYGSATNIPVITVDSKGRLTSASTVAVSIPSGSISVTGGDITMSGTTGTAITNATLVNTGVTAGTYKSVTVDAKGRVTAGTNPTTLAGYGITDAASSTHTHTLDSLSNVTITSNTAGEILKWNGTAWVNNTLAEAGIQPAGSYLTTNQTITFSGDATGSGSTSVTLTLANSGVTAGTYNNSATAVKPLVVDAKGRITGVGADVTITPAFSSITGKPTTLAGYGITDAATSVHNHDGVYEPANINIQAHISSNTNPHGTTAAQVGAYTTVEVDTLLTSKQATLVSNANIKTINGNSLLGSGDVAVVDNSKLSLAGGTMTGAITALRETKVPMPAYNVDLSAGNVFTRTVSSTATFTVSNVLPSNNVNSFILELTNGGAFGITWFPGTKWAGGVAPTLTVSGVDILGFYSHDGGVTWRGMLMAKDSK